MFHSDYKEEIHLLWSCWQSWPEGTSLARELLLNLQPGAL